jgi:hypothetical protein
MNLLWAYDNRVDRGARELEIQREKAPDLSGSAHFA